MSYSFSLRAADKAAAKAAVSAKFDEVVAAQACHARDRAFVLAAADAAIDLVADDPDRDLSVAMSGSLSGTWEGSDVTTVTGVSVTINAGLVQR